MASRGASKNPSDTWFYNDWENDVELKSCSDAAQGIWMRILCIMARSPERGVLILGNFPAGRESIVRPLANYLGRTDEYIDGILTELLQSKTASLDGLGRIINRRMVRAREISATRSRAGKSGARSRWQTDSKTGSPSSDLDGWQDHSKHHGKRYGKTGSLLSTVSNGEQREIPGLSTKDGCEADGKAMASSFFLSEEEERESFTEERLTAPAGAGADERGDSKTGSQKVRAEARGTRLPDGWQPSPEAAAFARELGLNPDDVTAEFRDYWLGVPGLRGRKSNWNATYRNRCRELAARSNPNGARQRTGTSRPQTVNGSQARNRAAFGAALNRLRDRGSAGGGDRDRRQEGDDARDVEATVLEPGQGSAHDGEEGA